MSRTDEHQNLLEPRHPKLLAAAVFVAAALTLCWPMLAGRFLISVSRSGCEVNCAATTVFAWHADDGRPAGGTLVGLRSHLRALLRDLWSPDNDRSACAGDSPFRGAGGTGPSTTGQWRPCHTDGHHGCTVPREWRFP